VIGIDLSLPPGWSQVPTDEFDVELAGPAVDGVRARLAIETVDIDPPLVDVIAAVRARQVHEYPGFAVTAEDFVEIDGRWAWVEHFRWDGEGSGPLVQLLALVVTEPTRVLKIDAVCRADLAAEQVPVLDAMIQSIELGRIAA
jgi:hypothetical protein